MRLFKFANFDRVSEQLLFDIDWKKKFFVSENSKVPVEKIFI